MPSTHITDQQVKLYMQRRQKNTLQTAAAKAGFSNTTAYRIEVDSRPPFNRTKPRGPRRPDPLAIIFEEELVPVLKERVCELARIIARSTVNLTIGREMTVRRLAGAFLVRREGLVDLLGENRK